jgi:hypothetical protein
MSKSRHLTKEEIEDIIESLPKPFAATRKCAEVLRTQIQNVLRMQLQDKSIKIVPDGIPKLKEYIRMQHFNSLVPAGEPVGIRAAEAIGQPTTQMSLNAFHSAGSAASVGSGIDAVKELYNVSQKRKYENMFIHFKDKYMSFEDIIDARRKIVGVSVQDLILSKEYYNVKDAKLGYWYDMYKDLYSKKIPKCTTFLRIYFDKRKLYAYNLTLQEIAQKIDGMYITCIPSPTREGIIDFYPNDDYNMETLSKKNSELDITETNVSSLFLQMSFVPGLKEEIVSGIKGITQIFTGKKIDFPVSSLIKNEQHIKERKWSFKINKVDRILRGVPIEKLERLLTLCKIKILKKDNEYYEVELPIESLGKTVEEVERAGEEIFQKNRPLTYITNLVKDDDAIRNAKTKEEKEKGIFRPQEVSELSRAAYYYFAISNGTNLMEVLSHELIDAETTISNNPHEILKALGIEASRNFLINEYNKILSTQGYINPRHLMLCADFQTSLGNLSQITARGVARQQVGPLSLASYEMAMDTLLEAAVFGKYEEANSTSSSIYLGKRMILGTGLFKMKLDTEKLDEAERLRSAKKSITTKKDQRLDSVAQRAMFSEANIEGDLLNGTDDMIGELAILGELGTNMNVEILKLKTVVPKVIPTNIEIPSILKLILKKEYKGDSKNVPVIPKSPVRAGSPKRQTISSPGMPSILNMKPDEFLASSPSIKKKSIKVDLNDFLKDF